MILMQTNSLIPIVRVMLCLTYRCITVVYGTTGQSPSFIRCCSNSSVNLGPREGRLALCGRAIDGPHSHGPRHWHQQLAFKTTALVAEVLFVVAHQIAFLVLTVLAA